MIVHTLRKDLKRNLTRDVLIHNEKRLGIQSLIQPNTDKIINPKEIESE